jgi:hypothetical protein
MFEVFLGLQIERERGEYWYIVYLYCVHVTYFSSYLAVLPGPLTQPFHTHTISKIFLLITSIRQTFLSTAGKNLNSYFNF